MSHKPKLIIFDLDYTLWPFWVDTHVTPPFTKNATGEIIDSYGAKIKHYPEVPKLLDQLHKDNYEMGVASRTCEIRGAHQLIELFGWSKYFKYKEIYPGCKVNHFNKFKKQSNYDFKDMIFFDDERRNVADLTKLGVTAILVKNGMSLNTLKAGLAEHNKLWE